MLNLYWKSGGETRILQEKPFVTEADLEKYLFANPDILGDIFILNRQVRTGNRQGIPDMLGVDKDGQVCLIELKNVEADESILPQALGYAIWAESNPDSVKALWLECRQRPEDIQVEWDNLDIRVVLVAPGFKSTVPRMAGKIGYAVELLQVRRYTFEHEEFLLVESLQDRTPPVRPVIGMEVWTWEYYEQQHGKEPTAQFRGAVQAVAELVARRGWNLPYNLNKYYTGFKVGSRIAFSVSWAGTRVWKLELKIPEETARQFVGTCWQFQNFDRSFGNAIFRPLTPDKPDLEELEPFFVQAYQAMSGGK